MSRKLTPEERQRRTSRFVKLSAAGLIVGLFVAVIMIVTVWALLPLQNTASSSRHAQSEQPAALAISAGTQRSDFAAPSSSASRKVALSEKTLSALEQNLDQQITARRSKKTSAAARVIPDATNEPISQTPVLLSIIIDDLGPGWDNSLAAIDLPYPLTMALLPYPSRIGDLAARATARGHEVILHLPMEPQGDANPGPNALLSGLDEAEFERRLQWALGRVPGLTGVNNHMGSRLTQQLAPMRQVMAAIRGRGLFFLDSKTAGGSIAAEAARQAGIDHATRDVFLDNVPERAAIIGQLERAVRLARRRGSAIAIGHPYPETIAALRQWLPDAVSRGVMLVSVEDTIRFRDCHNNGGRRCLNLAALR